jgi:DNA-binding CsgD family transcriptional regulator
MECLRKLIPFSAFLVSRYEPRKDRHLTIASENYAPLVVDHLNTEFVKNDPTYKQMRWIDHTPLRWCDLPPADSFVTGREFLLPAGFHEGTTVCLFTRQGRYAGLVNLNLESPVPPSTDAIRVLKALQPILAPLVLGDETAYDANLSDRRHSVRLGHADELIYLDPGDHGEWLEPNSPLIALIKSAEQPVQATCQFWWSDPRGGCHWISIESQDNVCLVSERSGRPPSGLTGRELEVLARLARGETNVGIGRVLSVTDRTVATHVEHLLSKLGQPTRSALVAYAMSLRLVPPFAKQHPSWGQ